MRLITDNEVVKVVNALVGDITPVADSYYDEEIYNNITLLGSVIDTLVCKVGDMLLSNNDSQFTSVEKCTSKAKEVLQEINADIDDYLEGIS